LSQHSGTKLKRAETRIVKDRSVKSQFPRWQLLIFASSLLAITLLLYAPVGNFSFVSYDDQSYIALNPHVRSGLTWSNASWAFTSLELANWHPLTWLSHMADCQLFGLDPAGPHYHNVVIHSLNVLLLFLLLFKATSHFWRSFYVSALFALHPINVQSVAWVAERKNVLSTLFLLIAIGCYGWYTRHPTWRRYLAVAGAFAASLMAKPMGVTFPFVLLLLDYWPLGRLTDPFERVPGASGRADSDWRKRLARLALEKLPLVAMTVASSWVTLVAQRQAGAMHPESPVSLSVRLGNALYSYFEYVRMTFWPSGLGVFYPYPWLPAWKIVLSGLFVIGVTALVVVLRRRKYLLVGWLFFLGTLVPTIGLVQVGKQAMADRYAYIPLLGLFVITVWLAAEAIAALRVPRGLTIAVAAGLLLAAGVIARVNLGSWQNSVTLYARARDVASRPDRVIEVNLGEALYAEGRLDESLREIRLAVSLDPQDPVSHYNLAVALLEKGQFTQAGDEFQAAVRYAKKTDSLVALEALNNLGQLNVRNGNLAEAWRFYSTALNMDPNQFSAMLGRGDVLYRQAHYSEAAEEVAHSILIHPSPSAWSFLGRILQAQGKSDLANQAFQKSEQLSQ